MNILLTNDDGIYAKGLWALYHALSKRHRVIIVAPDRERSAVGHGITIHQPLRFEKISVSDGYSGYALNGTPADCVKLGVLEIFDKKPDMVISGINPALMWVLILTTPAQSLLPEKPPCMELRLLPHPKKDYITGIMKRWPIL